MKTFIYRRIGYLFVSIAFVIFFTSCSSTDVTKKISPNNYGEVYNYANELVGKSSYEKAKIMLLDAVATQKPKPSPFVENGTLNIYSANREQTMMILLHAAYLHSVMNNDSVRNNPGDDKFYFDLYAKTPWENTAAIAPDYPGLYFLLGIIAVNEKKYNKAIEYLDTCVYIWQGFGVAWSELMYVNMSLGNLKRAKEIGLKAINIKELEFDKTGKAAIYRKLGYIAIEENDLDKAEEFYLKSNELDEHEVATQELEYIKKLKSRK